MFAGIKNILLYVLDKSNVTSSFSFSSPFPFSCNLKKNLKFFAEHNKHSREEERDRRIKDSKGYSPGFLKSFTQSYEPCRKRRNNIFLHLVKNKKTKKRTEYEHRVTVSYFLISNQNLVECSLFCNTL